MRIQVDLKLTSLGSYKLLIISVQIKYYMIVKEQNEIDLLLSFPHYFANT